MSGYNLRHRTGVSVPTPASTASELPDYTGKPDRERPSCKVVTYDRSKFPKNRYKANWRLYPKGCKIRGVLTKHNEGRPYVTKLNRDGKRKIVADFDVEEFGVHTHVHLGIGDNPETLIKCTVDSGAALTTLNKKAAIELNVIARNWNPNRGAKRAGSNGTYVKRIYNLIADGSYANAYAFVMKEVDVYVSGVKMETLKNITVSVTNSDALCLLGTSAIAKLKVVKAFKPLTIDGDDE